MPEAQSCLFLADWELARTQDFSQRRKRLEDELCRQQLQIQSALSSLGAWLAVLDSRRKLNEVAASAASQALADLESRWKPLRLEADGAVAAWLVAAERAYVAGLQRRAQGWATAAPEGGAKLRQRQQSLSDHLAGPVVQAVRAWDAAHQEAEAAWASHHERVEEASRAIASEKAPPDSWLSEVRYRERARKHLTDQAAVEQLLAASAQQLAALESERSQYWGAFVASYRSCGQQLEGVSETCDAGPFLSAPVAAVLPELADVPNMPSAGGAVLQRVSAAMMAPSGLFGLGSGGWREGATLVLTMHGYLHLFYVDGKAARKEADKDSEETEELVEADIKASVYAPLATKCVFQRRGQELILDLAEQEAAAAPEKSPGSNLRKWWAGKPDAAPLRHIHARLTDQEQFGQLERRCHEFVRRGHALRANASAGYS